MRPTEEVHLLRSELRVAKNEACRYKCRLEKVGDYEREISRLKSEVRCLESEKDILEDRLSYRPRSYSPLPYYYYWPYYYYYRSRSCSPPPRCYSPPPRSRACSPPPRCYSPPPRSRPCSPVDLPPPKRSTSPTRAKVTNSCRHSRLVARFNDLYAINRLDMQDRLRRFVCDDDMVKRIIFIAVCESFNVAKMAYRAFRLRARRIVSSLDCGPSTFEEAVTDYIVRNLDLYDVDRSVEDVIRAMNVNPKISFPPECEFVLLSTFIREACKIAYEMQALEPTLDIALATDGDLFCGTKYRRNYISEFSAPLVDFYVWPALMEDWNVLIKGECVTRHGASSSRSSSPRSIRSPSPGSRTY